MKTYLYFRMTFKHSTGITIFINHLTIKNDLRVHFSFIEVEFIPLELYEVCLFYNMHVSYCDKVCKI